MIPIDIETLPDPRGPAEYIRKAEAPSNYVDPEKIEAYRMKQGRKDWLATSLEPAKGLILCIGLADSLDAEPEVLLGPTEKDTLDMLVQWLTVRGLAEEHPNAPKPQLLAHNGFGFDFRWLAMRLIKHGHFGLAKVLMPKTKWAGRFGNLHDSKVVLEASLDDCAALVGYDRSANPGSGADVHRWFSMGDLASIVSHCRDDIRALQAVGRALVKSGLLP